MLAIQTHYIGPSNTRGSRVRAEVMEPARGSFGTRRTLTIGWDDALSSHDNHNAAAKALITRLAWFGRWSRGGADPGNVYVCAWREAAGGTKPWPFIDYIDVDSFAAKPCCAKDCIHKGEPCTARVRS